MKTYFLKRTTRSDSEFLTKTKGYLLHVYCQPNYGLCSILSRTINHYNPRCLKAIICSVKRVDVSVIRQPSTA